MARAHIAFYAGGMGTFYNRMLQRFGWAEGAERISREWARPNREGRRAAATAVTDEMLDSTSAVGSPEHARERLEAAYAAGVTLPVLMFPFGADAALMGDTLEALAPSRW